MAIRRKKLSVVLFAFLAFGQAIAQSPAPSSDAQAIITPTEARFVFPVAAKSLAWNRPRKGARSGDIEYSWEVRWSTPALRNGTDPFLIWMFPHWSSNGPSWGSLSELIRGLRPTVMINCVTCDGAVFADPKVDEESVTASVDHERLVITVSGREAIRHLFPTIPDTIFFETTNAQADGSEDRKSETVLVNCGLEHPSTSYHEACIVPPPVIPPNADSAAEENAPRRVRVVVLSFLDARVLKNVDVVIMSRNTKPLIRTASDSVGLVLIVQPPLWEHLMVEARCRRGNKHSDAVFGTVLVQVVPRMDTTVHLMTDPRICSM